MNLTHRKLEKKRLRSAVRDLVYPSVPDPMIMSHLASDHHKLLYPYHAGVPLPPEYTRSRCFCLRLCVSIFPSVPRCLCFCVCAYIYHCLCQCHYTCSLLLYF